LFVTQGVALGYNDFAPMGLSMAIKKANLFVGLVFPFNHLP